MLALLAALSLLLVGLGVTSASAVEPKVVVQSKDDSATSLDVSWSEVKGADGYRVSYSTDKDLKKSVKTVDGVQKGDETTIKGLDPAQTYYVQVTALDDKGAELGDSAVVAAATTYPYPAPGDIYATKVTDQSMTLSWKSVGSTPGYLVAVTVKGKTTTTETDKTSISLTGLKSETAYSVKVRAGQGTNNLSENSPSQTFTTSQYDLAAPDNLTEGKQRSTSVDVSFDKVDGLAAGDEYVVEYSASTTFSKSKTTEPDSSTDVKIGGLANDMTYYARTWVVDAKGDRITNRSDYIVIKSLVPRGALKGDTSGASGSDLLAVAYDSSGQAALSVPVGSDGGYELDVRPGKYRVQILYVGTGNRISTFAHSSGTGWTISQGTTYTVTEGDTTNVSNVDVKTGNVVSGTVLNAGKKGVRDVDVTAISGVGPGKPGQEREVLGMSRTDADGKFEIQGLADGPYWFRFHYAGTTGKGYDTFSQHQDVDGDLGLKVTLKSK